MKAKYWILIGVGVAGLTTLGIVGYKKGWFSKKDDADNSGSGSNSSSNGGSSSSGNSSSTTASASNTAPSGTPAEIVNALKNLNNAVTKYYHTKQYTDLIIVNGFMKGIKSAGYTLVQQPNGYYKIL